MTQNSTPMKLLAGAFPMRMIMRVLLMGGWLAALALMKTQGHIPVVYFLPLLSLVSLFLLDVFAGVVCATLTSGLVFLSPAVTPEAQFALLSLLWASMLLIVAFRHNTALEPIATPVTALATAAPVSPTPALTTFVTHLSHELRTPINLIIGISEAMLHPLNRTRAAFPAAYKEDVEAIQRNAWALQKTLEALTNGVTLPNNLIASGAESIKPDKVIHEAATMMRDRLRDAEIEVRVVGALPSLQLNRTFFRQMVLTVMQYAAKSRLPQKLVMLAKIEADTLIVGVGRDPQIEVKQAHEMLTPDEEAGLAFCRQFVATAHGRLWATGTVDSDRVYWISLPGAGAAHTAETARTIIICDDNRNVITFFSQQLPNWQVIGVNSREALLALKPESKPDAVVLTDETMQIAADEVTRCFGAAVPLITCPVASIDRLLRHYSRIEHLVKPVTYDALSAALKRLHVTPSSILVLDDNHDIVQMFSQMMQSLAPSAKLWKAYSGQEGLALITEQYADLVIVDLKLPDISGLELIPQIRTVTSYRDVPIMLVSGISEADIVHQTVNTSLSIHDPAGVSPEAVVRRIEALVTSTSPRSS